MPGDEGHAKGRHRWPGIGVGSLLLGGLALIAPDVYANNLALKGTLITPPSCILNGDSTLEISFGESIRIKSVPDGLYRQAVNPGLECDGSNLAWNLVLTVAGTAAGFDNESATVVTAEQADLGVKLYIDDAAFELNKAYKVNGQTLPKIEAVLVQREGAELDEGDFTARVTLRAEFQ